VSAVGLVTWRAMRGREAGSRLALQTVGDTGRPFTELNDQSSTPCLSPRRGRGPGACLDE
jgi:hypothetical protein